MVELLLPAHAQLAVITECTDRFPTVADYAGTSVSGKIPANPAEFMRVLAGGGSSRDIANDSFIVTLEGWSAKILRAERITAYGVAFVEAAAREGTIGGIPGGHCQVFALPANQPYPGLPDLFRYVATVSVDLRRSSV